MPNKTITNTEVAVTAIAVLHNNSYMLKVIDKQHSKEFGKTGAQIGSTFNIKRPWRKELDCWKRAFFHLMRTHRAGNECRIGAAVFVDMPMPKFSIKVDYDKDELVFVVEKE